MFVLERESMFGKVYYCQHSKYTYTHEVDSIADATTYSTSDEALEKARELRKYGEHYKVVRISDSCYRKE